MIKIKAIKLLEGKKIDSFEHSMDHFEVDKTESGLILSFESDDEETRDVLKIFLEKDQVNEIRGMI